MVIININCTAPNTYSFYVIEALQSLYQSTSLRAMATTRLFLLFLAKRLRMLVINTWRIRKRVRVLGLYVCLAEISFGNPYLLTPAGYSAYHK